MLQQCLLLVLQSTCDCTHTTQRLAKVSHSQQKACGAQSQMGGQDQQTFPGWGTELLPHLERVAQYISCETPCKSEGITWIADRVLIVVVGDVGVGGAAAPGKLQHHHAWCPNGLAQLVHICGDHAQVLCYDGNIPQLLQHTVQV